jgi:uncharacterized membrane protein HdeD (DUF308 family)
MVCRHWWLLLVRGIFAVLFGSIALADPHIVLLAFIYVFAVYAIFDGISAIAASFQVRGVLQTWWVLLIEGIAGIIFGILAIAWPHETALILLYLVAIWALITGVLEICAAFVFHEVVGLRWGLGIAGFLSIIFGIMLLVFPGAGLLSILWLVGIYAIVFGVSLIIYAFQVRSRASRLSPRQDVVS